MSRTTVILMDNAWIHKGRELKIAAELYKSPVLFVPLYSPFLSPVISSFIKRRVRGQTITLSGLHFQRNNSKVKSRLRLGNLFER